MQFSGRTPAGAAVSRYVFSGRDPGGSPGEINEVFLPTGEGWKACWGNTDWTMDLYGTDDRGKNWKSLHRNFSMKYANGITFLNRRQGYISSGFTPAYGWISLAATADGGVTWGSLDLAAPKEYKDYTFYTFPPVFFSDRDGLILTHSWTWPKPKRPLKHLVFVTHDAGKNWKAAADRTSGGALSWNCVRSDYNSYDNPFDTWRVTFEKRTWRTENGVAWEPVN